MSNPYEIRVSQDQGIYIKPGILHTHCLKTLNYGLNTSIGLIEGRYLFGKGARNPYTVFPTKTCWIISKGKVPTSYSIQDDIIIPSALFAGIITDVTLSGLHQLNLSIPLFHALQKIDISLLLPGWRSNTLCSHTILLSWMNYCKGQGYIFDSYYAAWSSFVLHYQRDNYPSPSSMIKILGVAKVPSGQPLPSAEEAFPGDLPTISLSEILESWSKLKVEMKINLFRVS